MPMTQKQIERTLMPVRKDRILTTQGMSYIPQQEVRAELTRTFGPGNWDSAIHSVELVYETSFEKGDKTYWLACYRAACTLRVRDYNGEPICEFTEYHVEENAPQPNRGEAHALALTSVSSYALRRAAIGIGDNMGLHLYNKGSHNPIVRGTLMLTEFYGIEPEKPKATAEQEANIAAVLGGTVIEEEQASE